MDHLETTAAARRIRFGPFELELETGELIGLRTRRPVAS